MNSDGVRDLSLESLREIPVVRVTAPFYQENCMVCFDNQGHRSGVILTVTFRDSDEAFRIHWSDDITDQIRQAHADLQDAVEFAACAITFLLVPELTEFTTVRQAVKGTTFDYYLAPKEQDDFLIFNDAAYLEISGILAENEGNTVDGRVRSKLDRLRTPGPSGDLPVLISIVEFSKPWSKVAVA